MSKVKTIVNVVQEALRTTFSMAAVPTPRQRGRQQSQIHRFKGFPCVLRLPGSLTLLAQENNNNRHTSMSVKCVFFFVAKHGGVSQKGRAVWERDRGRLRVDVA